MPNPRNRLVVLILILGLAVAGLGWWIMQFFERDCCAYPDESVPPAFSDGTRKQLGLMTSLPIYWPLDASMEQIASGQAQVPWQRQVIETRYELVPLDTLSSIAGIGPDDPETDPLAGLERIAVIQPRGLSPADNVALDDWVRAGGTLLLVLDPMLTGEYDAALGDPRRPVDTALIPPVVARWGLAMTYVPSRGAIESEDKVITAGTPPVIEAGTLSIADTDAAQCSLSPTRAVAVCAVGEGRVHLIADAAVFEHRDFHKGGLVNIENMLELAFD